MRKLFIIFLCVTAVLLGGYASYRGYKIVKQKRLVNMASNFLAKSDVRNAMLALQQALRSNPRSVEATRMMAELSDAARSPSAVLWRSRVVELDPKSVDDRLALAKSAMAFRDPISATNALAGVSEEGKKTSAYHNVAGTVAAATGQLKNAETHYLEAARLEPTNPVPQLNLAVVRLQDTNALVLSQARTALRQLCADPSVRCLALRELVTDAVRYRHTNDALALSRELAQQTNAVFGDHLLRLDVLRAAQQPEFKSALQTFQREATNDLAKIAGLANWEMAKLGPADALSWLRSLPITSRTNPAIAMVAAECYIRIKDWRGLQASLTNQNWAEMEFVRHAFNARALRGQELTATAKSEWEQALKESNSQKQCLVMLLSLAAQWNWLNEGEDLLWTIVNRYPNEKWAVAALSQSLMSGGRTRSLMTLYGQLAKNNPADMAIKNNLATTALLLDAKEMKPHELALDVYQKSPTNAAFASTYALSLHLQKKSAEALRVIDELNPKALEDPSIAGYYGLFLQAVGDKVKAKKFLDASTKARFLPEEQKLIDKAKAGI